MEREVGGPGDGGLILAGLDLDPGQVEGAGEARVVDEGVAIALELGDGAVAGPFGVVGRVLGMPAEQGAEPAHAGAGGGDEAGILDQLEVGLAGSALVADVHVEKGAGDVTAFVGGRHPGVAIGGAERGFGVGGTGEAGVGRSGGVVPLVAAGRIHVGVAGAEVVEIRVGGQPVVDAEGIGPEMFAVPTGGGTEGVDGQGAAIDEADDGCSRVGAVDLGEGVGGVEPGGRRVGQGLVGGPDPGVEVGTEGGVGVDNGSPAGEAGEAKEEPTEETDAHDGMLVTVRMGGGNRGIGDG